MKQKIRRWWTAAFAACLVLFTVYVGMDTFVIARVYEDAGQQAVSAAAEDSASAAAGGAVSGQEGSTGSDAVSGASENSAAESGEESSEKRGKHKGEWRPDKAGQKGRGGGKHAPGSGKSSGKSSVKGDDDSTSTDGSSGSSSGSSSQASGSSGSSSQNSTSGSSSSQTQDAASAAASGAAAASETESADISVQEYRYNDTSVYVADVTLKDGASVQTALAQNAYGRNVTAKTSETASSVGAALAINGDFYGSRQSGYVIRNGVLYRSQAASDQEDLVIYKDGTSEIIRESEVTAEELLKKGAWQVLSFGPALWEDGIVSVSENEEVGKAKASNPRTAIGIIDEDHYVFVVSDGRTDESEGLRLSELAEFMKSLGVKTAYHLDGGGFSTMYYNGSVINNPTTNGNKISEREVSDIVYIR